MNYKKIYKNLCRRGKKKRNLKDKTEKHHIIPRHIGGTNEKSNITVLTHKEHTIAHHLLYKLHQRAEDKLAYNMMKGRIKDVWEDEEYSKILKDKVTRNLEKVDRDKQKKASKLAGHKMYKERVGIHARGMHEVAIKASKEWAKENPEKAKQRSKLSHKNRTRLDYVKMANTKSKHIIVSPNGTEYRSVAEAEYYTGIARTTLDNWSRRNTNNWSRKPNPPID